MVPADGVASFAGAACIGQAVPVSMSCGQSSEVISSGPARQQAAIGAAISVALWARTMSHADSRRRDGIGR